MVTEKDVKKMDVSKTNTENTVYGNLGGVTQFHYLGNYKLENKKTLSNNLKELREKDDELLEKIRLLKQVILDLTGELEYIKTLLQKYGLE